MKIVPFSKHFLPKALHKKEKKGGKNSKQRITAAFFVSADGGKVDKPIVICKSKKPRCFKRTNAASKHKQVSYFVEQSHGYKLI